MLKKKQGISKKLLSDIIKRLLHNEVVFFFERTLTKYCLNNNRLS